MKKCSKCKKELSTDNFYKNKTKFDGFSTECKECLKIMSHNRYFNNIESEKNKRAIYYIKNKNKLKEKSNRNYHKNREKINLYRRTNTEYKENKNELRRIWYKNNRDKVLLQQKVVAQRYKAKRNIQLNNRRAKDPKFRLDCNLSSALSEALKGNKKGKHWQEVVGYSLNDLVLHLESQFDSKMNWNNYGSYWHIDHILPRSYFKYENHTDESFKKCWSLSNLRPLEAIENIRKGNKLVWFV